MAGILHRWLSRLFRSENVPETLTASVALEKVATKHESEELANETYVVPYDEQLLERSRTQWQFGDWQSLSQLNRNTLQHHPDRAKLALLAAAGRLQTGQASEAKQFIRLAQDWGVNKKLISQILIAGVHNSIGRAAVIGNQQHRAFQHFESAITIGTPGTDAKLLAQVRCGQQLSQIGMETLRNGHPRPTHLAAPVKGETHLKKYQTATAQLDLLLTTFPAHKSMNVGDNLISQSARNLIKSKYSGYDPIVLFREDRLDRYADGSVRSVISPGFSVSNGVYPQLFGLYSDIKRLPYFVPVGCSFQHPIPAMKSFTDYRYSHETLNFLKTITELSGPMPCRDQLIVDLLHRHDIPAVYSGDIAIYDENIVGSTFLPPHDIKSLVFTIQHHDRYFDQSCILLDLLHESFPNAQLFVAFHSKVNPGSRRVANHAIKRGFSELHLYGNASNLSAYDAIDVHIGYRLHGHISFLRRRKPSILLVEDARSFGFSRTKGTAFGTIDAFDDISTAAHDAPINAITLLLNEKARGYSGYLPVFDFIDKTYSEFCTPFFDSFVKRLF